MPMPLVNRRSVGFRYIISKPQGKSLKELIPGKFFWRQILL